VKILAAIDLEGDLARIAMRGARYGFPGWVTVSETKSGKPKHEYLGSREAADKARAYLAGARSAADHAGRCIALVAMARLADEQAVPASARSFFELSFGGYYDQNGLPWSDEVLGLIEDIACERLPEHLTERLRAEREERERQEAEERAAGEVREHARAELRERLPALSAEERAAAVQELQVEHGWHASTNRLAAEVRELEQRVAEETDSAKTGEEEEPPAA
jgi:hypothetical protein